MKDFRKKYDVKLLEKEINKIEKAKELEDNTNGILEEWGIRAMIKFITKIDDIDEQGNIRYTFTMRTKRGFLFWLVIAPFMLICNGVLDGIEEIADLLDEMDRSKRSIRLEEVFR